MHDTARLAQNLAGVKDRIAEAAGRSGRKTADIRLVAVTKTVEADVVEMLHNLGVNDFGENRSHIGVPKVEELRFTDATWHFIGHLQRRKVRDIIPAFNMVHSLDSLRLAEELQKNAAMSGIILPVLLEIKVSDEDEKLGITEEEADSILRVADRFPDLEIRGLMCMAPYVEPEETRPFFAALREMRDRLEARHSRSLPELSMGMSNDYRIAVEEGATIVRVGSALFDHMEEL